MKKGLISNITNTIREQKKTPGHETKPPGVFSVVSLADYVDKILRLNAPKRDKIKIGKEFLAQTGIPKKELARERNRHPYYKRLKNKGHTERQRARNAYNKGVNTQAARWDKNTLLEFISLTDTKSDIELARHFNRSIPAIQAIRRRINVIKKAKKTNKITEYILFDERTLRKKLL